MPRSSQNHRVDTHGRSPSWAALPRIVATHPQGSSILPVYATLEIMRPSGGDYDSDVTAFGKGYRVDIDITVGGVTENRQWGDADNMTLQEVLSQATAILDNVTLITATEVAPNMIHLIANDPTDTVTISNITVTPA